MVRYQAHQKGRRRPPHGAAVAGLWPARLEQDPPGRGTDGRISVDAELDRRLGRNAVTPLTTRLRPGDLVGVRAPDEFLQTLDVDGTFDHLPFIPAIIELCGERLLESRA